MDVAAGEPDFAADVNVENMMEGGEEQLKGDDDGDAIIDKSQADRPKRKKTGNKRGGVKRRMASIAYHQLMQQRATIGSAGGRPVYHHNHHHPMMAHSMPYPNAPSAPTMRPFPIRKFGFFNETAPSVHPGHPGSEKRSYDGPMKARLMMEELARTPGPSALKPPPPHMFNYTRDRLPIMRPAVPVPGDFNGMQQQQSGSAKSSAGMNELFAKMVWKKLDMIENPTRLNRLHTEIMNILQQAIAEEGTSK